MAREETPADSENPQLTEAELEAYFARIGYKGPLTPELTTLNALARAHVQSIPFENLDVLLGRPIDLGTRALVQKLVHSRRGGYCFEQNGLFFSILERLGFAVRPLSARVRLQRPRHVIPPRTHLFNVVTLEGKDWLIDVGIGAASLTNAILLSRDVEQATSHDLRRIIAENGVNFHQLRYADQWNDVYEFTGETMPPIDRELANWYTSAHPNSLFKHSLMVARAADDTTRLTIQNNEFTRRRRDGSAQTLHITSPAHLLEILDEHFGLLFPTGTQFDYSYDNSPPAPERLLNNAEMENVSGGARARTA